MKLKFFILAAAFSGLVLAVGTSANLRWVNPTEAIDNEFTPPKTVPYPATAIKETLIEWRRPGNATVVGSIRVPGPANTATVPNLDCGDFEFVAYSIPKTGSRSDASSPPTAYVTGVSCTKPNPITGLAAQ